MAFDPGINGEQLNPDQSDAIPAGRAKRGYRSYDAHNRWDMDDSLSLEVPIHWSVPWSDLMMVMMVMFAVMFVTKLAERDVKELFKKDSHLNGTTLSQTPYQSAG